MNLEKLTNKTREALLAAQNIAMENSNSELRTLHVLAALARQDDGLVPSIARHLAARQRPTGGLPVARIQRIAGRCRQAGRIHAG